MFDSKNFSVMAYANGFTLWNYSTKDTSADITGQGYFNATEPFVRPGDMILAVTGKEGTIKTDILFVASVASGAVSVSSVIPAAASAPAAE